MALEITAEMDEVLTMSLDDYIAKSTCNRSNSNNISNNNNNNDSCSFKSRRRNNKTAINVYEDDDEEEEENGQEYADEQFEKEIYGTAEYIEEIVRSEDETPNFGSDPGNIWKGPNSKTDYIDLDYMEDDLNLNVNIPNDHSQVDHGSSNVLKNESIYDSNFDLRNKISSNNSSTINSNNINNQNKCVPYMNSQQWRLMRPNNAPHRPAGMPPLVPNDTLIVNNGRQWRNNRRRRNNRGGWKRQIESGNACLNGIANFNDGRIQKTIQRNDQDMLKNISTVLEHLNNGYNKRNNNHIEGKNMTIQIPNDNANRSKSLTQSVSLKSISNVVDPLDVQQTVNAPDCPNNNLRSLLGIKDNFTREEMPMLASKLLDFLKSGSEATTHKPIYDMKIQKEIHDIQKKPLMYKCPGGEVVSSDGAGISNCTITPRSSGVSMNYRFA